MTVRLIAITQDYENYGREHWKAKGGIEVLVASLTLAEAAAGRIALQERVDAARSLVDFQGEMFERQIIGWSLYFEGELTPDEKLQMEFDGKITYPPRTLESFQERHFAA